MRLSFLGRLSQLRNLGDQSKRIAEAKKKLKEVKKILASGVNAKEWFLKLPFNVEKDTFTNMIQHRIGKTHLYKEAPVEKQARYMTIIYETIEESPSAKITPTEAITIGKKIEERLNEYDRESKNPN